MEGVQPMVSDEMRATLAKPYTSEEVGVAIREMASLKALGPDGVPPLFFQTYWTDVACSKIISPRADSSIIQVRDLFYLGTWIWDPRRLVACFLPWEAEVVARITLCVDWDEDILIWPLTSDGEYSVHSAYRMLVAVECSSMLSSSSSNPSKAFWKAIWKIRVHNKILHFIWSTVKDSLTTKQNLKSRHVSVDDICDGCGDHVESIMHCLWLCDQAKFVWRSDPGFSFLFQKEFWSVHDLLEEVFNNGSGFRVALFATGAWCLWQRRNRVRKGQPSWQLHEISEQALALVHEFWEVQRPLVRWSPPLDACYKGNFDATLFDGSNCAGFGVVFWDSSGNVIATLSQWIGHTSSVDLAEALVTRRAVLSADTNVWVEELSDDLDDVF
nr:uncharacterized protein LOC112027396 [Quercus suber]